jgi:hypothetical protein
MPGDARPPDGVLHRALEDGFVKMVAPALAGDRLDVGSGRREDPLPAPLAAGVRVLAGEGIRELHPPGAARHVVLVLEPHGVEMARQCVARDGGGQRPAASFPRAVGFCSAR